MTELRCEKCPHFINNDYCTKLRHPLENGHAMFFHSKHCDAKKYGLKMNRVKDCLTALLLLLVSLALLPFYILTWILDA